MKYNADAGLYESWDDQVCFFCANITDYAEAIRHGIYTSIKDGEERITIFICCDCHQKILQEAAERKFILWAQN